MTFGFKIEVDDWCTMYAVWPDPGSRSRSPVLESHSRGVDRQSRTGLSCYFFLLIIIRIFKNLFDFWVSLHSFVYVWLFLAKTNSKNTDIKSQTIYIVLQNTYLIKLLCYILTFWNTYELYTQEHTHKHTHKNIHTSTHTRTYTHTGLTASFECLSWLILILSCECCLTLPFITTSTTTTTSV